ncbi:hypothetical protein MTO96_039724, partial [Rhipicephalus appendiculatus]
RDDGTAGNISVGENIRIELFPHMPALEIAYRAFKSAVASRPEGKVGEMHLPNLEDYTEEQVFFLTYCHGMGAPTGDRRAARRCNVPLRNFRPFAKAFGCPARFAHESRGKSAPSSTPSRNEPERAWPVCACARGERGAYDRILGGSDGLLFFSIF